MKMMIELNALGKLSPSQLFMKLDMINRCVERMKNWNVSLVKEFPSLIDIQHHVTLGSFAWSCRALSQKWIMEKHAINYGAGWVTPGDIARDYLSLKYPDRRLRITTSQYDRCVRDRGKTPLYCAPCTLDHALYVDIKAAYWSIVHAVGWDVNYNPGKFIGVNSDVQDFPFPDEKLARNCLVSVGLPSKMRTWNGVQVEHKSKPNRFINLLLWRIVCDVLNGVAAEAVSAGAVYCYTDGFIIPVERYDSVKSAINSWGLECSVKHEGACTVTAPATYSFPNYTTRVKPRHKPISIDNIDSRYAQWLKPKFSRFSNQTVAIRGF